MRKFMEQPIEGKTVGLKQKQPNEGFFVFN